MSEVALLALPAAPGQEPACNSSADPCERIPKLRHANVAPTCCSATRVPGVQQDGLASLLRTNNNSTHHGVDAAAAHLL